MIRSLPSFIAQGQATSVADVVEVSCEEKYAEQSIQQVERPD